VGKTTNGSRKNNHSRIFGKQINYGYIDCVNSLSSEKWKPLECYWIEQFRQWGFDVINKNKGGGGASFHTNETRLKMLEKSNKNKNQILELYKTKSILEISKIINLNYNTIKNLLLRNKKYEKNKNHKQSKFQKEKMKVIMINKLGKITEQYDKEGEFIREWVSQAEIQRCLGINQPDISRVCNKKQKTAGGYIWKFKN
jgi:DNA-binding CsgD family transcriptional regulator